MASFYKYCNLVKQPTHYARRMNRLSNRIFGEVARPTDKTSMKVVKLFSAIPGEKNPELTVDYYPRHVETGLLMKYLRNYGLFRDEHQDFKEEMRRLRELRGKVKRMPIWVVRYHEKQAKDAAAAGQKEVVTQQEGGM